MRLVFFGLGISGFCANAGFLASSTFLALYARKIGIGMGEIGLLMASYYLVSTIMTLVFGRLSDVAGLKKVLILLGLVGSSGVYWLLGVSWSYLQLLVLWGFLLGVTDAAHRPASVAVIAEIAPRSVIGRSVGFYNAFMSAGMAFGSLIGGAVADLLGLQAVFRIASILLIVGGASSLVVAKLKDEDRRGAEIDSGKRIARRLTMNFLLSSGILLLCVDVFLRNCGFRGVSSFLSIYLTQLGADNTLAGSIMSLNFFSQIFFMPLMGWISDKVGRKHILSAGMLATFLATFFLSIVHGPIEAIPIQVAIGFSWASITVASNTLAAETAPPERLGAVMGMVLTSMSLGGVVGPAAAGLISEAFDLRTTFRVLALFPLVSFILSIKLGASEKR